MDPQQAGHFGHGLALRLDELAGMGDLLGREGRPRPEAHTARLGRDPAGAGALHNVKSRPNATPFSRPIPTPLGVRNSVSGGGLST